MFHGVRSLVLVLVEAAVLVGGSSSSSGEKERKGTYMIGGACWVTGAQIVSSIMHL